MYTRVKGSVRCEYTWKRLSKTFNIDVTVNRLRIKRRIFDDIAEEKDKIEKELQNDT